MKKNILIASFIVVLINIYFGIINNETLNKLEKSIEVFEKSIQEKKYNDLDFSGLVFNTELTKYILKNQIIYSDFSVFLYNQKLENQNYTCFQYSVNKEILYYDSKLLNPTFGYELIPSNDLEFDYIFNPNDEYESDNLISYDTGSEFETLDGFIGCYYDDVLEDTITNILLTEYTLRVGDGRKEKIFCSIDTYNNFNYYCPVFDEIILGNPNLKNEVNDKKEDF